MAKKQGIDDISKAIMKAIEAARAAGKKAKPASIDVSDGMTKTYPKKQVKDPVFGMQKVKIDSGDAYRSYDKGTPEYNAAYKKKMADKARLAKMNKEYMKKGSGNKNLDYQEALRAEKQADNWFRQSDGGAKNSEIVRKYVDPKGEAQRVKNVAKFEKNVAKFDKKVTKKIIKEENKNWMMPDGELMPRKKAKKALKKYGPK